MDDDDHGGDDDYDDDDYDDVCGAGGDGGRRGALGHHPPVANLDGCRFLCAYECYHWDVCGNCFPPSHGSEDAIPVSRRLET